jgi:Leucine-rich repeat (LRR) protein
MKNKKFAKGLAAAVLSLLLVFSLIPAAYAADTDPAVTDSINAPLFNALVAAGAAHSNTHYYTVKDLHDITGVLVLNDRNPKITDISGLENCNKITRLHVAGNDIDSMPSNLSQMAALNYLDLGRNPDFPTDELSKIKDIPNLKTLDIQSTGVKDVSDLSSCSHLDTLYWQSCGLTASDLDSLKNLPTAIISLDLGRNPMDSACIAKIKYAYDHKFTNLTTLGLNNCGLTDASAAGLTGMNKIVTLNLGSNPSLHDIGFVGGMTSLGSIYLTNDNVTDLTPLAGKSQLRMIELWGNQLTDDKLAPLSGLNNLQTLYLASNSITSLSALSDLNSLATLGINHNFISDLTPVSDLKNCSLDISDNALYTAAGADKASIDLLKSQSCTVTNTSQKKFTVNYVCDSAKGTPSDTTPESDIFYEQPITVPDVAPAGQNAFMGWDKDGNGSADIQGGASVPFTTALPAPESLYNYSTDVYEIPYTAVFGFNIGASANNAAYGTVSGAGAYASGASATLHAAPAAGYRFVRWTEGGTPVSTSADYTFAVSGARTLVAEFAVNTYSIAASANNAAYGTVTGGGTYSHNATASLTAAPNTGYGFVRWTEGGTQVSTDAQYSFTVTGARTLVAEFGPSDCAVGASPNDAAYGSVTGAGSYAFGAAAALHAAPNTGYHFVRWTEGGNEVTGAAADYSFTVSGNRTLIAEFAPDKHTVGASPNDAAYGTVSGAGTYDYNSKATLTAAPNPGYCFVQWTENGTPVCDTAEFSLTVTADRTFVAVFSKPGAPGLTASSGGVSSIRLTWTPVSGATGYEIWRSGKSSGTFVQVGTSAAASFTDKKLKINTVYYYKVRAMVAGGAGEYSNVSGAKPLPLAPAKVTAKKASKTGIKVSWSAVSGASGYMVYQVKSSGTVVKLLKKTAKSARSYTQKSLKKGKTYYYKVCAFYKSGSKTYKGAYSIVVHLKL